jgi:predicted nucleotidyltransferase
LTVLRGMRKDIRRVRKRPIDTIFSPVQQDILAATYDIPEKWWYLSELAAHSKRTASSLQRDLSSFAAGGVLESRRDGGRVYYRAGSNSVLFAPLKEIVDRSLGIETQLANAVGPVSDRIEALFVYGSVAKGEEGPESDIDILCVGDIGLAELAKIVRPLEKRFGRDINVSCYSSGEFDEKLKSRNHFITSLRREPKIFIVGSEDVFGRRRRKRSLKTS